MNLKNYLILVHVFFIVLFLTKFINVIQDRIDLTVYLFWIVPMLVFYRFIVKLNIKAYQWFCFVLLIFDGYIQFFFKENLFGWPIQGSRVSSFFKDELIVGSFLFAFFLYIILIPFLLLLHTTTI